MSEPKPSVHERIARVLMPLDPQARAELKASIEREGVRDPVVVWKETGELVDGRTRTEICRELKLPDPPRVEISFASEEDAVEWVLRNQLGRRNLTPRERSLLRGRLANMATQRRERNLVPGARTRAKQDHSIRQLGGSSDQPQRTHAAVAAAAGVSARTVERDAQYARAADKLIARAGPEAADLVVHGELRPAEVIEIVDDPTFNWDEAMASLRERNNRFAQSRKPVRSDPQDTRPFFQRGVVAGTLITYEDDQDGKTYCDRVQLTCGHWHTFKRQTAKCGKAYPCPPCGSGTRRPHAVRVDRAQLEARIREAVFEPHRLTSLASTIEAALALASCPPSEAARAEKLSEDVHRFAQAAGVCDRERAGSRRRTRDPSDSRGEEE